jgi:hypothetical protein
MADDLQDGPRLVPRPRKKPGPKHVFTLEDGKVLSMKSVNKFDRDVLQYWNGYSVVKTTTKKGVEKLEHHTVIDLEVPLGELPLKPG